ncbi:MAG: DNA methyltransferase [Burkholderiaceae bacterium]
MPLSWNEIKSRAIAFSKDWSSETSERAESQSFWNAFFHIFGIERRRVASFEQQVAMARAGHKLKHGRIDGFWKGVLLIEHKSAGQSLDRAFSQAVDYFEGLPQRDLPRYVLVSDFTRLRLSDFETGEETEFALKDLHKHIKRFGFIAGYQAQQIKPQDPVNIRAAEQMGKLHDALKASGYEGHPLEVLLVRTLFCLFADDTGIFQPAQAFRAWIEDRTSEDGADLGPQLAQLFQVLNTPEDKRSRALDEQLRAFPYVNGKLFDEALPLAAFSSSMRESLLDACAIDWSGISPAIFGALFQSIMDGKARRNLGAHYTSEENILKLIKPLFLDELRAEFERIKGNRNKLFEFHKKLRTLNFFDPACGCGNFLVITYRELRLLELDVLRASRDIADPASRRLFDSNLHHQISIDVDQFHGIEIEEFPAQIAQVALWLIDHQMNVLAGEEFGLYFARIPLKATPHIVHGNALRVKWEDVLPAIRCSFVLGNPPFGGKHYQSKVQRLDQQVVTAEIRSGSDLDFVACWFVKAADYIQGATTRVAFVATNSISQGEQVPLLWGAMLSRYGVHIHFAHRTFKWSNEARGNAAVHCVILGFALGRAIQCRLFDYETPTSDPQERVVSNINPYLLEAPTVFVGKRASPVCVAPKMSYGNKPSDGGHLILSNVEKSSLLLIEPGAGAWLRRYVGADDFINGVERWCLWLEGISPHELRRLPNVLARVEAVQRFREGSTAEPTRRTAATPTRFFYVSQPRTEYIVIPEVSSERRRFIPIGYLPADVICSNTNYLVAQPSLYVFGVLTSLMHMAWTGVVCGRLKSDYRYSASIVYNNFPWPESTSDKQRDAIESAAQVILDTRLLFPGSTLADLYDPLAMPPALLKAHQKLDAAVDAAYGRKNFKSDAERVAFLFELYQRYTSLLPAEPAKTKRRSPVTPRPSAG